MAPYGELVGTRARRPGRDHRRPRPGAQRYDHWGHEVDEVVHHPTWLANKADLVRTGFVGLRHHAGRPVPGVVTAARAYLVSQCRDRRSTARLGMTGGAADIVERYAPLGVRDALVARLNSLDPSRGLGGRHVPHRAPGRQ